MAPVTTTTNAHGDPFASSRSDRRHRIDRTKRLLSAVLTGRASSSSSSEFITARSLTAAEVSVLEGAECRCRCDDWAGVRILSTAAASDASGWLRANVSDTYFSGLVVLSVPPPPGAPSEGDNVARKFGPPGIRSNLLICDSILEAGCVVIGNGTVSNVHVMCGAALVGCGSVSFDGCGDGTFRDGATIVVGAESGGGRDVKIDAESTLVEVCAALHMGEAGMGVVHKETTVDPTGIPMNMLCPCSFLAHTPEVCGVYLSSRSYISGATSVARAVLLPHSSISNSVTASDVFLQWNSSLTSNSSVETALVMEHSHIGPNSIVAHSILGPDVHVSAGEIHASLLGPNTNAHHQSLVIGVLWPLGRGNVGYGANVGSNHTSRLPDQECASGEGTFWGLTTCVKMPIDVTSAPYSVIAAGTSVAPGQRVAMPFSLIIDGPKGGTTNIMPGWVLYASPYTVSRSEAKFANRRKAKRHGHYTGWRIVRPGVVDMCVKARQALVVAAAASPPSGEATKESAATRVYKTDRDVPGIGASHLSERSRLGGIKAYTDLVQLYALRGLMGRARDAFGKCGEDTRPFVEALGGLIGPMDEWKETSAVAGEGSAAAGTGAVAWPALPWEEPSFTDRDSLWEHQLGILRMEGPSILDSSSSPSSPARLAAALLRRAATLETEYAARVRKSKARDDVRGAATIPGYAASHVPADDDPVVKDALREAEEAREAAEQMAMTLGMGTEGREVKSRL